MENIYKIKYRKYKNKYFNLKKYIKGGTIYIKEKNGTIFPFKQSQYQFKKGRSKPDDEDFYNNETIDFDIDFSWKTTRFNEAMILYYILEATGVHNSTTNLMESHLDYKYIIKPSKKVKEYSFNLNEFLSGIEKSSDKFNCRLMLKKDVESNPDSNKIIYMKDLWNDLDIDRKKIIVQCMALSIHYRVDQQYYFWNEYMTEIDLIAFKLLSRNRFTTTNLETFVSHNDVILEIYNYYKEIIGEDENLLNILDGNITIPTNDPLWTNFYLKNIDNCVKCKQIYNNQIKERNEEINKEKLRIQYIEEYGSNELMPSELIEGKLYVPQDISSLDIYNRIKTIHTMNFNLDPEVINKIDNILEIIVLKNDVEKYYNDLEKINVNIQQMKKLKNNIKQKKQKKINNPLQKALNEQKMKEENNNINKNIEKLEYELEEIKKKSDTILQSEEKIEKFVYSLSENEKIIYDREIKKIKMSNKEIIKIHEIISRFFC